MSLSASTLKNTSSSSGSSNLTLEPLPHSLSEYLISKHLKTITAFIFPQVTLDYHQHIMFIQDQQTCAAFTDPFSEDDDDLFYKDAVRACIESHNIHSDKCEVTFRLKYKLTYTGPWYYVWLEEKELQLLMPIVVLAYWKSLGGRCQTTQFPKYHVLRILEGEKRHYKIQWIGYSEEDFSWETKKKIKDICPWAVPAWKAWNKN